MIEDRVNAKSGRYFEVPKDLDEGLQLLRLSNHWDMTVEFDGQSFNIFDRGKRIATASDMVEVEHFIYGMFYITFWGDSRERVLNDLPRLQGQRYWTWFLSQPR